MNKPAIPTIGEELLSAISHGVAALLSLVGLIVLILSAAGDSGVVLFAVIVYGISLFLLYLSSTLYHALSGTRARQLFQRFDHISIFLLIAGTYTPISLCIIGGPPGWHLFILVWAMAVLGITFKAIFGARYDLVSTVLYVLMGWSVLLYMKPLLTNLETGGLVLLALGGLFYTGGVYFYLMGDYRKWLHGVWHFFVAGGSLLHYFLIFNYVVP